MKKLLLALLVVVGMALPSWADLQVRKIDVQPSSDTVSIRVQVLNPSTKTQAQPIQTRLFVRKGPSDKWTQIQSWKESTSLGDGETYEHTWQDDSNAMVRKLVASGTFEIKVTCTAPGLLAPVEYRQVWKKPTDGL